MPNLYVEIFREHFHALEPVDSGESPRLDRLEGIRAVLFDLYGTLFVSASGEVGTAEERTAGNNPVLQRALEEALGSLGLDHAADHPSVEFLFQAIEASHARGRQDGIDYPEVDIVEIWREILPRPASGRPTGDTALRSVDLKRLAVEYEARANPCWPMPHLQDCLERLHRHGLLLGIISNAQFYTAYLFEALLGESAEGCGFERDLQYYSYLYGRAKPGTALFATARATLEQRRIEPEEVLYVGNDILNDVLPAREVGFRTALFAGDARSLRRREEDSRAAGISPDLIITDLAQLPECMIQ
ncbi:MAG TPA: HAD family hydrolase [Thermoguttaceae bacterium]|nr:HAD family hydrolase [Thermoguttaceae bacterium]